MRLFRYIVILLIYLPILTNAQDTTWTYQEQCASRATPDAWTFDGTILVTGYGGLHGINANWETPRVVASIQRYSDGRLSPDNNWYAEFLEDVVYSESYNHLHNVEAIQVYSTSGDNLVYTIPWQNSWLQMWGYREMYWVNNSEILYEYSEDFSHELDELSLLNPFEQTRSEWESAVDILDGGSGFQRQYVQFPAPDFTRTITKSRFDTDESIQYWGIYDVASGDVIDEIPSPSDTVFQWLPDSSGFIAQVIVDDETIELQHFDNDGHLIAQIMDISEKRITSPLNINFSDDGQYFALALENHVMIAHMQSHEIFDTCLSTSDGIVWSPNGAQIAYREMGTGIQDIYVFDINTWSYREVARHIVETLYWDKVIGWRAD